MPNRRFFKEKSVHQAKPDPFKGEKLNLLATDLALNLVSTFQRQVKETLQSCADVIGASNDGFGGLLVYDKIIPKLTGVSQTPSNTLGSPIF